MFGFLIARKNSLLSTLLLLICIFAFLLGEKICGMPCCDNGEVLFTYRTVQEPEDSIFSWYISYAKLTIIVAAFWSSLKRSTMKRKVLLFILPAPFREKSLLCQ